MAKPPMNSRGWTQVVSGLDIIVWSRLASWDESRLELKAALRAALWIGLPLAILYLASD